MTPPGKTNNTSITSSFEEEMNEQKFWEDLNIAFEYTYLHDEWVNPLTEALAGVDAVEANWRPTADSTTIWEIVLHTAVWNENIVERIRTGKNTRPVEGHWPTPDPSGSEVAWETAYKRLWDSCQAIHRLLENMTVDALDASPYGLPDLLCRYVHIGYHLGQITKLRDWYKSVH